MINKRILIIDEDGFARICSAILEHSGYRVDTTMDVNILPTRLNNNVFGLIITSYPYGAFIFDEIKKRKIPAIILSDAIDVNLINSLEEFDNSYCMVKPVDYEKFRSLVTEVMDNGLNIQGGTTIV